MRAGRAGQEPCGARRATQVRGGKVVRRSSGGPMCFTDRGVSRTETTSRTRKNRSPGRPCSGSGDRLSVSEATMIG